jgi:uncharacterized protein
MSSFSFECPKCECKLYDISELRGSSGGFTAFMNLDLAIFTVVSCRRCGFSEFFRGESDNFRQRFVEPSDPASQISPPGSFEEPNA